VGPYIIKQPTALKVFTTKADVFEVKEPNFEYCLNIPNFYLKANFANQSKSAGDYLSEIFIYIKKKIYK
jgi:hypothetical protein